MNNTIKVCIGYVVKGEPLNLPDGEYSLTAVDAAPVAAAAQGDALSQPAAAGNAGAVEFPPLPEQKESGQVYGIVDPDYGRVYTMVRKLAWEEGYAIGLHGSFTRDLDMVAVPWEDGRRCNPEKLVARIVQATGLREAHGNPGEKPHGRKVWTLLLPDFGDPRFVDLSIVTDRYQQGRAAGIEEAAKEADDIGDNATTGTQVAAAIRALNKTGAA